MARIADTLRCAPGIHGPLSTQQRGGTLIGLLLGAAAGLGLAAAVAAWVQQIAPPELHSTLMGAAHDERERVRNEGWNPNASPILGYKPPAQLLPLEAFKQKHLRTYPQAKNATDDNSSSIGSVDGGVDNVEDAVDNMDDGYPSIQYMVQIRRQGSFQPERSASIQNGPLPLSHGGTDTARPVDNSDLLRLGPFENEQAARQTVDRERAAGRTATLIRIHR